MNISSAKITGTPDTQGLTLAHDYTPDEPNLQEERGRLIILVTAPFVKARELLETINQAYYGDKASSPYYALKLAVEKNFEEGIEIAAATLTGTKVFVAASGGAQIGILRSGMLAKILASSTKDTISASGTSMEGDTVVLGTSVFFDSIPEGIVKAALQESSSDGVIEALAPVVESLSASRAGAVVVKFKNDQIFNPMVKPQETAAGGSVSPTRQKIAGFLDSLLEIIPERRIFVRSGGDEFGTQKKRNVAALVGMLLILILVISIGFGIRQRGINLARSKYESRLQEAQHQFTEAQTLSDVDTGRARELVLSAKSTVEALQNEGIKDPELDVLAKDIKDAVGKIAGVYEVEPEHYLDLSLLSNGMTGDDLSFSDGRMLVLDRSGEKLVEVTVDTKKTKVLAGPEVLSTPQYASPYSDKNYLLDSEGVKEVEEQVNRVIEKDWSDGSFFYAYFGNIYVLDRENSNIWRYAGDRGTFGSQQNWFGPGVSPNLSTASDWTIDGSVWVLLEGGRILKFTLGKPDAFSVKGLAGDFAGARALYSDENTDYLYVLDSGMGRVVVIDKETGNFKAEYMSDRIKESTDFAISESNREIVLLNGEKLYSIEIKHLD